MIIFCHKYGVPVWLNDEPKEANFPLTQRCSSVLRPSWPVSCSFGLSEGLDVTLESAWILRSHACGRSFHPAYWAHACNCLSAVSGAGSSCIPHDKPFGIGWIPDDKYLTIFWILCGRSRGVCWLGHGGCWQCCASYLGRFRWVCYITQDVPWHLW